MNCYAAFAKDPDIRNNGSSGGFFPLISLEFIRKGGVVFAAEYDSSFNVVFNRYTTADDLKHSFTSKYVQSRLNDTFLHIKKDLKNDLSVLFCGTPCQTSALTKYLKVTKTPTHKLLVLNFICHGVPSESIFHQYLERFSTPSCTELNMRSKDLGWDYGCYAWKMTFSDNTTTTIMQTKIPYMKGFLSNLYLRPSCYACNKDTYNSADITIGDFWGISEQRPDIPSRYGVSCVIVRSQKGCEALENIQKQLQTYPVSYSDILISNPCLHSSAKKPYFRSCFFKHIQKGIALDTLIERMGTPTFKNRLINKLYSKFPYKMTTTSDLKIANQRTLFANKEHCCGCGACNTICPSNAITLKTDEEGFIYPVINISICTDCHLCEAVCPFAEPI